jgi:2-haloalkanoic acid dehalogenase type II
MSVESKQRPRAGVLCDLLMGVMNSMEIWSAAAGDRARGLAWRDAVTARMITSGHYVPYEGLVADAAADSDLPSSAPRELFDQWAAMVPWPDAAALGRLTVPYGFVTNCSAELARLAASRSGLKPRITLAAEDAGWYKPDARIYREACRRLGSEPHRTLFVAGSPYDADGAHRAGLRAWFVARRSDQRPADTSIPLLRSLDETVQALVRDGLARI